MNGKKREMDLENGEINEDKRKITDREWKVIQQYRKLCEENKLTMEVLMQRLLAYEKGRE